MTTQVGLLPELGAISAMEYDRSVSGCFVTVICMLAVSRIKILNGTHMTNDRQPNFFKISDWLFFM